MSRLLQRLFGSSAAKSRPAAGPTAENEIEMEPTERDLLVATAREWGYFSGAIKTRLDLWQGRRMLDIGMGAGPHSISFIEGGAQSYIGVDPLIGSDHVRDFRYPKDPSAIEYHAFPFAPADIMRIYPNIRLFAGLLENVAGEVKAHKVDFAMMAAVTEHLARPYEVIRSIWDILEPGGHLWVAHCNYYSWTGHHRAPRSVAQWDRNNAEHAKHVDWQHLDARHPDYGNANFNRIRLQDLRTIIDTYFEIVEWKISVEACDRLTPDLRARWKKYTLAELLGQNIYITGRRRDVPLQIDLSGREFHHPREAYLADADHASEDMAPYRLMNAVYFSKTGEIHSHSDNDHAGLRVFDTLRPGQKIVVAKFVNRLTLTVDQVVRPAGSAIRLKVREAVPETCRTSNRDQWSIEV